MSDGEPVRLTREQARLIDKLAIERYHIPGIVLMENAARAVADVTCSMLSESSRKDALVLCGGGNNGGDGLAVARHLHNRNIKTTVALYGDPERYAGDALKNWLTIQAMGLPWHRLTPNFLWDWGGGVCVDGIFGTGLTEVPRDPFKEIADYIFLVAAEVVAIDIPSGLNCDTGLPFGPCIDAVRTVTFVAEKAGFAKPASKQYTGKVTVGDIGCPRELIEEVAKMSPR